MIYADNQLIRLAIGIFSLLTVSTVIARVLARRAKGEKAQATIGNLTARINAWWWMFIILGFVVLAGTIPTIILFALISFLALREFITLTPTNRGDHAALFWCFFVILPIQYVFVATEWYGLFVIFIPVYASFFVPVRIALAGDSSRFMERTAKIQWGLVVAVFFISHIPALLMLDVPGYEGQNIKLLLFLVLITQMSDVLQYVFGKLLGRHAIVPKLSPNKTVEGFLGGRASAVLLGTLLYRITPFSPWEACAMSTVIVLAGFAGGLCMSAVKRDRGVKDFGEIIQGHGGMMDRMDSLCFAAPVFFHLVRFFFS